MGEEELNISDIDSLERDQAFEILAQIARVEKRHSPPMRLSTLVRISGGKTEYESLVCDKCGIRCTLLLGRYAVYVLQKGVALLHKVRVTEAHRRQEGCRYIQLWVDRARTPARSLYWRTGIRMIVDLERGP
ncbi:hypothetical protein BDV29DRAFT_190499 [Aspergillus leporis]|uniref:Uncharacterized protein n=1 Tax=Aspergillus leporis TaxID=41062 RepID=A0A5N5X2L2_9EURO|nr:hypothetical protein BDV29DRAFT_190499 [Aspergillus leporis]